MFQKSQDSELKVVKLLTEPLNDSEKREREREKSIAEMVTHSSE